MTLLRTELPFFGMVNLNLKWLCEWLWSLRVDQIMGMLAMSLVNNQSRFNLRFGYFSQFIFQLALIAFIFPHVTNSLLVLCNQSLNPSITITCYDFFIYFVDFFSRHKFDNVIFLFCFAVSFKSLNHVILFFAMIFVPLVKCRITAATQHCKTNFCASSHWSQDRWEWKSINEMTDEAIQWQIIDTLHGSLSLSLIHFLPILFFNFTNVPKAVTLYCHR